MDHLFFPIFQPFEAANVFLSFLKTIVIAIGAVAQLTNQVGQSDSSFLCTKV